MTFSNIPSHYLPQTKSRKTKRQFNSHIYSCIGQEVEYTQGVTRKLQINNLVYLHNGTLLNLEKEGNPRAC